MQTEEKIILVNPTIRTTHLDPDFYYGTEKRYVPCMVDGMAARGIDINYEKVCPEFVRAVGVSPTSPDWDLKVREYYADFVYPVPFPDDDDIIAYHKLDAGFVITDDGVLKPNKFKDYMLYNMMIQDSLVLVSDNITDPSMTNYDFVITDLSAKEKMDAEKHRLGKDAIIAYVNQINDDSEEGTNKIKLILANNAKLLGLTAASFHKIDRVRAEMLLKRLSESNPKEFITSTKDKYLTERATFLQGLELGVITTDVNGSYVYKEITLGSTKEAIKQLHANNELLLTIMNTNRTVSTKVD